MPMTQAMKSVKQLLQSAALKAGYRIERAADDPDYPVIDVFELAVRDCMRRRGEQLFVVQIGANDGREGDPIRGYIEQHRWRGLLVEPQPRIYERLLANYADQPQLLFENALIFEEQRDNVSLFTVRPDATGGDDRLHVMARLNRDSLARELREHGVSDPDGVMEELKVPSLSPDALLEKHGITAFDVLVIDAEGYDFEIVKMFDLERYRPAIVYFEFTHLSPADQRQCLEHLAAGGYRMARLRTDIVAYRQEASDTHA